MVPVETEIAPSSASTRAVTLLGDLASNLRPLTVLHAPMGWGKTALLERWLSELPTDTPRLLVDVEGADWLDDLRSWSEKLTSPGVAVVDDYQLVTSTANDFALLRTVVANPRLYLVVAGRRYNVLDTPAATLRVDTNVITRKDLALTDQEVLQLARKMNRSPSESLKTALERADGWQLAVEEMLNADPTQPGRESGGTWRTENREVFDDPGREKVFRLILLTGGTSAQVLRDASGLSGRALNRAVINLLEWGLIEERWAGSRMQYVPNQLLEDCGNFSAPAGALDEDEERALLLQAENLAQVDPAHALKLLLKRGLDRAAGLLGQSYFLQLASQRDRTAEILAQVGDERIGKSRALASLRMLLGFSAAQTPVSTLRAWAQEMRSLVPARPVEDADLNIGDLALMLVISLVEGKWGDVPKAGRRLENALALRSHATKWTDWTTTPLLYSLVADAGLLSGDLALAKRAATQSLNVAKIENNRGAQAEAHHTLAVLTATRGRTGQARQHLDAAAELLEDPVVWVKDTNRANATVAEATVLLGEGDFEGAKAKLEEAEPIIGRTTGMEAYMLLGTWVMRLAEGNLSAFEWLRRQLARLPTDWVNPLMHANLTAAAANLLIYEGELRAAEELLEAAPQDTDQICLSKVRLLFARGNTSRVPALLVELDRPDTEPVAALMATFIGATFEAQSGNTDKALRTLERLKLLSEDSLISPLLTTIPYNPMKRLAEAAAEAGNGRWLRLVEALPEEHRFQTFQSLSPSEQEVVGQLAKGKTSKEVASARGVSPNTIKAQTRLIYRKLRVSKRSEMVRAARELGLG